MEEAKNGDVATTKNVKIGTLLKTNPDIKQIGALGREMLSISIPLHHFEVLQFHANAANVVVVEAYDAMGNKIPRNKLKTQNLAIGYQGTFDTVIYIKQEYKLEDIFANLDKLAEKIV